MYGMSASARYVQRCLNIVQRFLTTKNKKPPQLNDGEWLADTYPDMAVISTDREKVIESFVRRIRVKEHKVAEEIIDELANCFEMYKTKVGEHQQLVAKTKQSRSTSVKEKLSDLEFDELRFMVKESKNERNLAYDNLLKLYATIPNIVEDISLSSSFLQSPISPLNFTAPSLTLTDCSKQVDQTYLTGQQALLHLELTDFTAAYLEAYKFVPITFPTFLRREVREQSGVLSDAESDIYTLMTKPELHAASDDSEARTDRKAKVEDNFIFHAHGLCELTMMSFFLRRNFSRTLPMILYSIGNQYRMPHVGEPTQSKIGLFITASRTKQEAVKNYLFGVALIENFWKEHKIDVIKHPVAPHRLAQHEACAVEFLMSRVKVDKSQVVLSRMSLSYDYVSRRIMAFSSFSKDEQSSQTNTFCQFTTGKLIDINLLLEHL